MRHEYIVSYEVWQNMERTRLGTIAMSVTSDGPPDATQMARQLNERIATDCDCLPTEVRLVGIFKL